VSHSIPPPEGRHHQQGAQPGRPAPPVAYDHSLDPADTLRRIRDLFGVHDGIIDESDH
jgi:hypothetical protein